MKTALLISSLLVALLIYSNSHAAIVDNYTDRQLLTDNMQPGILRKTSLKQLDFNSDLGTLNRTLVLNTPYQKTGLSWQLIGNGNLTINTRPDVRASIIYDFNNFNLQDYDGIRINKPEGGSGQLQLITNGPAGRSKSAWLNLNDANLYAQLQSFTGSELFNNINRLRLNFNGENHYHGGLSIELLKTAPVPIPAAAWLFLGGLLGILKLRKN